MTRSLRAARRAAAIASLAASRAAGVAAHAQSSAVVAFPKTNLSTDVTDIWWPDSEPGWGIQLIQNADIIFATMFVYDPDGNPTFFVATLGSVAGATTWTGDLFVAGGTPFDLPWNPADRVEFNVGTMTFSLTGVGSGTLDYTVGPSIVHKELSRQPLKLEDNSGDYRITHTWTSAGAGCTAADFYSPAAGPVNGDMAISRIDPEKAMVSLTWRLAPLDVCSMTANYAQVGRLGAYAGTLTCPTSGTSGTLALYEIANRPRMLTGRYEMIWDHGCTRSGQFTAIMATP
jgi:hypothetical protein